jgi:hypothetical protein
MFALIQPLNVRNQLLSNVSAPRTPLPLAIATSSNVIHYNLMLT